MKKLSSDELGEHGQDVFKQLCSAEKLHANPSLRDRTGWDFRVEQPNSSLAQNVPLDLRQLPEPVMVQVKSVYSTSDRISLKLNTFERLARLPEPAFIVVPVFDEKLKMLGVHAIHIVDGALKKTLHRLAEIYEKGQEVTATTSITFSRGKWLQEIDLDCAAPLTRYFENEIKQFSGAGPYSTRKCEQLEQLGYEDGETHSFNVTITAESEEEIYEGFLGIRPLQITKFQNFDHRFGLKRPLAEPNLSGAELTVSSIEPNQGFVRLENASSDEVRDIPVTWDKPGIPISDIKNLRLLVSLHQLRIFIMPEGKARLWIEPVEKRKTTSIGLVGHVRNNPSPT